MIWCFIVQRKRDGEITGRGLAPTSEDAIAKADARRWADSVIVVSPHNMTPPREYAPDTERPPRFRKVTDASGKGVWVEKVTLR